MAYSSAGVLPGMMASLPPSTPLVIVNNGPDDGVAELARSAGARLLSPGSNLGFGAACNLGAARADGEFLFFLNPDTRLSPDALPRLLAAADARPEASAFGPLLIGEDGEAGYKRRSFLDRANEAPRSPGPDPIEIPSLSGAAMLIRRSAFEAVGGFDPDIFLYYEDDDLAFRLRHEQGALVLVPAAHVRHAWGKSTPASAELSRFKGFHWARSRVHVARKHGLRWPWAMAMKNAVWHLVRPKSWRSAERRAEALGRIKGAWTARSP